MKGLYPISIRSGYDDWLNGEGHDRSPCVAGTSCCEMVMRSDEGELIFLTVHAVREDRIVYVRRSSCFDICMNMYFDDMNCDGILDQLQQSKENLIEPVEYSEDEMPPDLGEFTKALQMVHVMLKTNMNDSKGRRTSGHVFLAPYLGKNIIYVTN